MGGLRVSVPGRGGTGWVRSHTPNVTVQSRESQCECGRGADRGTTVLLRLVHPVSHRGRSGWETDGRLDVDVLPRATLGPVDDSDVLTATAPVRLPGPVEVGLPSAPTSLRRDPDHPGSLRDWK